MKKLLSFTLVSLLLSGVAPAITLDFVSLAPNTAVTNQYPGVTFFLAGGPDSAGPPTTTSFAQGDYLHGGLTNSSHSGAYPTAQILGAQFSGPVEGVSFSFYTAGTNGTSRYTLYDAAHSIIASALMPEATNFSYFYDLSAYHGVYSIEWTNGMTGSSWWQDVQTLSFTAAVPEAGIISLLNQL